MQVDTAIETLGIDLLRELQAISHFCDSTADGIYALVPSDRRYWYEQGGRMHLLVKTGCVRLLSSSYCETVKQWRHALRMEQFGRQVLMRTRGMGLNLDLEESCDA